ncbi:hypothetical protein GCM10010232_16030 [Streptomyces amakusaensis]|uniref:S8 family serine peptidase n=1 Tax=Streptomyces amakusaensis TaxID=67271 RepID=A0ABW0AHC3_9ACTN
MLTRYQNLGIGLLAASISVTLVAGMTGPSATVPAIPTQPTAATATAVHKKDPSQVVTLLTGDRVRLGTRGSSKGQVLGLQRAKGREGVPVRIRAHQGRTLVVPEDARRLIDSGRLDRRLFDLTELSSTESRAAHRDGLKVIVGYGGTAAKSARGGVRATGDTRLRRTLAALDADAVTASRENPAALWEALTEESDGGARATASGISRIWLDGVNRASLDKSVSHIGVPGAWASGYDGKGVTIAVLDTGVDASHPDLKGRLRAAKNFSASADAKDRHGHGTHVASIAAGTGAKSGGTHKGVAPGAEVISGKVLDDDGYGSDSDIAAGMEWAADQGAGIVNLSLGGMNFPGTDPKEAMVEQLSRKRGVLFAVSAGNSGQQAYSINSPGTAESALTVGATDGRDGPADFSSSGPNGDGGGVKPDVTAPGVGTTAAAAAGSSLAKEYGQKPDGHLTISGTSMASPHAAGAAALLKQRHPRWTYKELKGALSASARDASHAPFTQGTGRIAVDRALKQTVLAEKVSLDFGEQLWPHSDNTPVTKRAAYRNLGDKPVTLALSVTGHRPDGDPAPDGFFTLGADRVTVPAGGTASVGITADTRRGSTVSGHYSASVSAVGGGQSVRTTATTELEAEAYDVTVKHIARDGGPGRNFSTELSGEYRSDPETRWEDRARGIAVVRAPKGEYTLQSSDVVDPENAAKGVDLLTRPRLSVTEDITLTVDARTARPVSVTVPDAGAKPSFAGTGYTVGRPWEGGLRADFVMNSFAGLRTAHLGPRITDGSLAQTWHLQWEKGGKTEYRTASGGAVEKLATGYSKKFAAADFATVRTGLGGSAKNRIGALNIGFRIGDLHSGVSPYDPGKLPVGRTVLLSVKDRAAWGIEYQQITQEWAGMVDSDVNYSIGEPRAFTAGRTYQEDFNSGVVSPALARSGGVNRAGNHVWGEVGMFTDGAGHPGWSAGTKYRTELYRGRTKIGEYEGGLRGEEGFEVGPGDAEYTLRSTVSRPPEVARATSRTEVSFTFRSKKPADGTTVQLPASTARFGAKTALDSTVPAGGQTTLPVTVEGAAAGSRLRSLAVQVSHDGGRSWRRTPVTKGRITVKNPAKGKSVSLRAEITDTSGNRSSVSVIDAYFGK